MPNLATFEILSAVLPEGLSLPNDASFPWFEGASGTFSGVTAPYLTKGADDSSSDDVDVYATLAIDAVVREVSLETLCFLASKPGILASMYQVTDCSLSCDDVVTNLFVSLAGATTLRLLRRRSKRLRPRPAARSFLAELAELTTATMMKMTTFLLVDTIEIVRRAVKLPLPLVPVTLYIPAPAVLRVAIHLLGPAYSHPRHYPAEDIPFDVNQDIKHNLQNKLHRCAGPGDLNALRAHPRP
jgi:hypothetical protein